MRGRAISVNRNFRLKLNQFSDFTLNGRNCCATHGLKV
jgi:hypothetical protein